MKHSLFSYFILFCIVLVSCKKQKSTSATIKPTESKYVLLENATILDLDSLGTTTGDLVNGCILIKDDLIEWVGKCSDKPEIPINTKVIDGSNKYIIPGLFDGFAAINNQSYCNAYLYMGVTNIISVDGGRRGDFYGEGNPTPNIYRLEGVGLEKIETATMVNEIDTLKSNGYDVLLLMYGLTPSQIEIAISKAKTLNMATIGEMGLTTYKQGMDIGLDAFVHTTRYSLDIAPRDMANDVAHNPFSNDLKSPKWMYYSYLTHVQKNDSALLKHAQNLAASQSFIMPTMSLSYLDLPDAKNPWLDPVATILDAEDINRPADPQTGKHDIDQEEQKAYSELIANETSVIEPTYYKAGAKYLSGSATDVWGTMPGISLHTELMLLHTKAGLTNEEVLAAATSNFSDAFGWKVGKIKAGFEADLLLLNANPIKELSNLTKIDRLFIDGEELDPAILLKQNNDD